MTRRRLRAAGLFAYADPGHEIEYTRAELLAELTAGGFTPAGFQVVARPAP